MKLFIKLLYTPFILLLFIMPVFAQAHKEITVEDIFKNGIFKANEIPELHAMKDGKSFCRLEESNSSHFIVRYSYATGAVLDTLLKESRLGGIALESYTFNDDESAILIATSESKIYRRSTQADNYVYSFITGKTTHLTENGFQTAAKFSPNGKQIAWVHENNLFLKDISSGKEIQITNDGKKNQVINGACDWVYEEEFEFFPAFFWSPESNSIAYYRFDETKVPVVSIPFYEGLYPTTYNYKYPKAGEKNAVVEIYIYNLLKGKSTKADLGQEKDQYIPRIRWTASSTSLCIERLNRHQNKLEFLLADASTGNTHVMLTQTDKAFFDIGENTDDLKFLKDQKHFILSSDENGFRHIYLYDLTGKKIRALTSGSWDVTKIYGSDELSGKVFYQAAYPTPMQRSIFSVSIKGSKPELISSDKGTSQADFNSSFTYFIKTFSSINHAPQISVNNAEGKTLRILEENKAVTQAIELFQFSKVNFIKIPIEGGQYLNASIIKPAGFEPSRKYPVLMYVYGGPGSQQVIDDFKANNPWHQLLVSKGYIVVTVDNRGTGGRGAAFEKLIYKNLGKLETEDQINAARWLAKQPYVDGSRIGIWGWSFGGYMSSLCITRGADVFKAAIAVAPVTSWRFYDSIYTERFLTTPQENPAGYDENSPLTYAKELRGKFLLVHGTADDNVHYQNSIMFSEALIQADKPFQQAYYPNKNHGIYGGNTRSHLFNRLTDFVLTNL